MRTIIGWRQEDLARAAGTRKSAVSSVESAGRGFSFDYLKKLVASMGLPLTALADAVGLVRRVRTGRTERAALPATLMAGAQPVGYPLSPAAGLPRDAARLVVELLGREVRGRTSRWRPEEDREAARALWRRLQPYGAGERRALVREAPEFQTWAVCELLCAESERAAAHDATVAVALGELAVEVATVAREDDRWRGRLEGYARAFAANALRAAGQPRAAGEAFARALAVWESGAPADPHPLDASRLLDLEASLRRDQRRLDESLALLDHALLVHPTGPAAGRLLLKRAKTLEEAGDYQGAVTTLRRASAEINPATDPRLALIVRQQLAWDLGHLGHAAQGEKLLAEARVLALRLGNRLDLLRVRWVEGFLAGKRERTADALAALAEVRDSFAELDMPYDAALATIELAALYASEGGHAAEVKALAAQARPTFEAQQVHPEARKALTLFSQAAAEERLTLDLARALASYLQRARHDPGLRFEGVG